jgi:hypothetical protein
MRDGRRHSTPPSTPLDDEAIGLLVRDVASGWAMPPVRLDAPSWRDRVRSRRARLLDTARAGFGRAGRAAMAATALTVGAALVAVVITRPSQQPAGSPNPTSGASSEANPPSVPAVTPLPKLVLNGDLPFPSRILVTNEAGDIALVDLAAGTIGGSFARAQWPSAMTVTADGVVVCICITTDRPVDGYPTRFDLRLKTFTRATTPIRDTSLGVVIGSPDARTPAPRLEHVLTSAWFSPDDRYAVLGWSARESGGWHSQLVLVDIDAGALADVQELPGMTAGEGDARRLVSAPRVLGMDADGNLLVARAWAEWGSANTDTEPIEQGDDAFTSSLAAGGAAALTPFSEAASCGPSFLRAGPRPGGGIWVTCLSYRNSLTIRRLGADGTNLGSESVARTGFVEGDTTAVSPDGGTFYAWDPGSAALMRVDLATGARTDQRLPATTAAFDPLTAIGRWLAPGTDAKSILRGAILVSPDASRLYLLTTLAVAEERDPTGSSGILVVDAQTLTVLDRWPPTADFMSMALSPDGGLLYAAGLPGVDAAGDRSLGQGASVTVFDTTSGAPQLIAGQLGMSMLSFPGPVVP